MIYDVVINTGGESLSDCFSSGLGTDNYVYYNRFAGSIFYLTNAANPIIYFVTVRSFREFVKRMLRGIRQNTVEPLRLDPTNPRGPG